MNATCQELTKTITKESCRLEDDMDYGIYTTQGKKKLLGIRATVNERDAIAYVKNGVLQSYAYMDDFASQFYSEPRMSFDDPDEKKRN